MYRDAKIQRYKCGHAKAVARRVRGKSEDTATTEICFSTYDMLVAAPSPPPFAHYAPGHWLDQTSDEVEEQFLSLIAERGKLFK